jgi:hypothetical protein
MSLIKNYNHIYEQENFNRNFNGNGCGICRYKLCVVKEV